MAEETKAIMLQLRPKFEELRGERSYKEHQVKNILFAFARDLGCTWRADRLRKFIDTAFDF